MDIHTLHVEHTVLLAVYTLLTIVNARIHRGIRGIHWFSFYNALLFVGALLVSLRGHTPDFLSIVGGNMFVVCGYVALFLSLVRFFGTKMSQLSIQLILAGIGLATMLQWGLAASRHKQASARLQHHLMRAADAHCPLHRAQGTAGDPCGCFHDHYPWNAGADESVAEYHCRATGGAAELP